MTVTDTRPAATPLGQPTRARWERPGLLALLAATAVLYLWGLGSNGWANSYYAAAAQAGTQSWKALFFGSFDAGNAITVDKPPAAMWVMGLSGRLFGFNEFTMLLPQALMGVAAVAVLYATVRRCSGPGAGLLAGAALALTPVATSMFRYNNPDALLVLLLVIAAYCTVRAIGTASVANMTTWMALTGGAVGFAFLTKMLQAFLVLPGLGLAFLIAGGATLGKRVGAVVVGVVAMVFSAGWYIALVSLWPADARPYIAGSTDNSLLQLALGYNGIQRITGSGQPGGGGGHFPGGGPGGRPVFFGGEPGLGRLFNDFMGTEVSWLLPAALIGVVAALWFTRRSPRTGSVRAQLILWAGWLIVTGAVFCFMDGTVHPYYAVALAPAVAALLGISLAELWQRRQLLVPRLVLAVMLAGTGVWTFVLLDRNPDWWPAVRWIVLVGSVVLAVVLAVRVGKLGRATAAVAAAAVLFGLAGSAVYSISTVADGHSGGPMPTSGPARAGGGFGDFGPPGGWGKDRDDTALQALITGLDYRWAAATIGSMQASGLELKTGASIMSIGGFAGGDNSPTLEQFQHYVTDGQVRYFIAADRGPGGHGGPGSDKDSAGSQISAWVQQHYAKLDVGGTTVYDLSKPLA
ncbi:PMT family glycosyltransferase, 4-amino-4-deoxy-L-arabinose transferase [Mycolicibacterium canariasense]|uniref:PMT family glycosyltransferase, 4-amino-4-deoxy-L-arabinose transferase n=1 Tax=Mycolicibacterium canariasense TaxID=228230 RepID=A0A124E2G4_MYCCR|nr:glycosyltransferase family 39 protein [Mycolicibacterium canariasense]MCV7210006.1 glycosyltransferase family 39 protein [Mycolicibacterium canariasense]ORV04666.1 glycosyl transferase [Mycolicibacterium canariasense]GAS96750.1 PMT family glycosyltransferase, 4-amino-4-deoxy-L-arabinose transferase [Mycolicibacterium canariasense]